VGTLCQEERKQERDIPLRYRDTVHNIPTFYVGIRKYPSDNNYTKAPVRHGIQRYPLHPHQ
jgi:hypothetical protein